MIKVYRSAADIPPEMMKEYYAASSDKKYLSHGEHTVGIGMYFAINKELGKQYGLLRKPNKYFVLGSFNIVGEYKIYDNVAPETLDPDMLRLENLIRDIQRKQNENLEKKYGKSVLHNDDFLILSFEEIDKILEEQSAKAKQERLALGIKDEDLEEEASKLGQLYWQAVKQLNDGRLKYDISIFDYEELCIHNPSVNFNLSSFDIYFNNESDAQKIFNEIKTGELSGSTIKDIDGSLSALVSSLLIKLS